MNPHPHSENMRLYAKARRAWVRMRSRCRSEKDQQWPHYGGRGISVCSRWENFQSFLEDMGLPPEGSSIDRIDNDGNYEPGNCRWTDQRTQIRNRRVTVMVGDVSLRDACETIGFPFVCAYFRHKSGKRSAAELFRPIRPQDRRAREVTE